MILASSGPKLQSLSLADGKRDCVLGSDESGWLTTEQPGGALLPGGSDVALNVGSLVTGEEIARLGEGITCVLLGVFDWQAASIKISMKKRIESCLRMLLHSI